MQLRQLMRRYLNSDCQLHTANGRVAIGLGAIGAVVAADNAEIGDSGLRGRSVLLHTEGPLETVLNLLRLDGLVGRMILYPPDVPDAHLEDVIREGAVDAYVGMDGSTSVVATTGDPGPTRETNSQAQGDRDDKGTGATEWVLLTSATTGAPKLVQHTLESLMSAFADSIEQPEAALWGTFYDIRRYGGLQILLRGLLCGAVVLPDPGESTSEFLRRAGQDGLTHISGTPSHWRRVLMSGAAHYLSPRYVRLSGEIADQSIIDALRRAYPAAQIVHAFATTEAGVAMEIDDGLAGFPRRLVTGPLSRAELRIEEGTLRVRSPGNAIRYLGVAAPRLHDSNGFVDTGDRVVLRNGRYYFLGRVGGVINVGGLKVHPEEVESVINSHPGVRQSLVKARRSPITGSVVSAEVVLTDRQDMDGRYPRDSAALIERDIREHCRRFLAEHKIPAVVRIVESLEVSPAGKLMRRDA